SGLVLTSTENVSVEIMNYGLNAQSNFDVSYTINGGAVVTETVAATINPGGSYTYTFTATEDFSTSGTYTINAYTSLSGDEDASNDALVTDVLLMNWVPDKRVFGEEATGTWCGWCVRGHVYLEYMQTNYPDSWIGVAVHNGDPMVEATYDAAIGTFIGGYPSGLVDRADGEKDPLEFEMAYDVRIDVIPVASVDITNINWNSGTRQLSFDVEATFAIGLTGTDYRLNAILREDNVTGTDAGYNQANYYSGGTYGAMGGYESLPNPVPAAQMTYQNVARVLFGGWDGTAGTVTANIAENETFSYTYSYTLPAEWDETNVKMVGIIIDQNTGEVMNANMSDIPVSVIENAGQDVVMYPNPTEGIVYFRNADNATITVYDILGNVIAEYQNVPSRLALNLMDQPDGTYVIRVQKDDKVSVEKMIISR
ncbi:MAG: Omp28-related outer membrane protein, partial [Bacteroidota bacterium]